jgi:hypothetical protein
MKEVRALDYQTKRRKGIIRNADYLATKALTAREQAAAAQLAASALVDNAAWRKLVALADTFRRGDAIALLQILETTALSRADAEVRDYVCRRIERQEGDGGYAECKYLAKRYGIAFDNLPTVRVKAKKKAIPAFFPMTAHA